VGALNRPVRRLWTFKQSVYDRNGIFTFKGCYVHHFFSIRVSDSCLLVSIQLMFP